MTSSVSRRGLVAKLALALPLAASVAACHPTPVRGLRFAEPEESGADAELLVLGREWEDVHRTYIAANFQYLHAEEAAGGFVATPAGLTTASKAVWALETRIGAATATTLPGLLVKARVAGQLLADECEPEEALTAGLVRDLLALVGEPAAPSMPGVGGRA